jgi:hypothetical protein
MDTDSIIPPEFEWPDAWEPVSDRASFLEAEAVAEIPEGHVLAGRLLKALAQRVGRDDVLFSIDDLTNPFAVLHLTWGRKPDLHQKFPWTTLYRNLRLALQHCDSE